MIGNQHIMNEEEDTRCDTHSHFLKHSLSPRELLVCFHLYMLSNMPFMYFLQIIIMKTLTQVTFVPPTNTTLDPQNLDSLFYAPFFDTIYIQYIHIATPNSHSKSISSHSSEHKQEPTNMSGVWIFMPNGVIKLIDPPTDARLRRNKASLVHLPSGKVVSSYTLLKQILQGLGWERYFTLICV